MKFDMVMSGSFIVYVYIEGSQVKFQKNTLVLSTTNI